VNVVSRNKFPLVPEFSVHRTMRDCVWPQGPSLMGARHSRQWRQGGMLPNPNTTGHLHWIMEA